jgi:hypothetical protein
MRAAKAVHNRHKPSQDKPPRSAARQVAAERQHGGHLGSWQLVCSRHHQGSCPGDGLKARQLSGDRGRCGFRLMVHAKSRVKTMMKSTAERWRRVCHHPSACCRCAAHGWHQGRRSSAQTWRRSTAPPRCRPVDHGRWLAWGLACSRRSCFAAPNHR